MEIIPKYTEKGYKNRAEGAKNFQDWGKTLKRPPPFFSGSQLKGGVFLASIPLMQQGPSIAYVVTGVALVTISGQEVTAGRYWLQLTL